MKQKRFMGFLLVFPILRYSITPLLQTNPLQQGNVAPYLGWTKATLLAWISARTSLPSLWPFQRGPGTQDSRPRERI